MGNYKYSQLNDFDWLYEKYITNQMSTLQISTLVGCKTANSVRQALIRFDIPIRNISESLTINNDIIVINDSVITGCLLGDGWLRRFNNNSELSYPYFIKKNKYKSHIEYIASYFYTSYDNYITPEIKNGNLYYIFRTNVSDSFMPFYKKWYIDGTRQPPDDINIDNISLLHWFMDDGSTYLRRPNSCIKQIVTTLSCEGFHINKIEMLESKLQLLGLQFKVSKCNSGVGYRLSLSQRYYSDFIDYIGTCPIKEFLYKWK